MGSMPGAMIPAMNANPLQVPSGGVGGGMPLGAMTGPAVPSHMAAVTRSPRDRCEPARRTTRAASTSRGRDGSTRRAHANGAC